MVALLQPLSPVPQRGIGTMVEARLNGVWSSLGQYKVSWVMAGVALGELYGSFPPKPFHGEWQRALCVAGGHICSAWLKRGI